MNRIIQRKLTGSRVAGHRGIAMVLVLFAVVIATVLSMSFLQSQSTTHGITVNVSNHAQARQIAESAMQLVLREISTGNTWRSERPHGVWFSDQAMLGGTVTVRVEDGQYDPVTATLVDADGDLADDNNDYVTVLVTATYQGTTHTVRMQVRPGTTVSSVHVLMIVQNSGSLTDEEEARKELIEGWGWQVTTLWAEADSDAYTNAMAATHVIYVPEEGGSTIVGNRLNATEMGVVFEDGDLFSPLGVSTEQTAYNGASMRIVDNTHYITAGFGIGELTFANASGRAEAAHGSIIGGLRPLAWWPGTERRVLATVDTGQLLSSGSPSPGRRAALPFSGFAAADLNEDGQLILRRALEWSAQASVSTDTVTALSDWTTSTSVPLVDGEDRLLVVTVSAETHASLTSLTYGHQELTLVASAYESTGVGARTFLYVLREANLRLASDSSIRSSWTSGSRDDTSFGSRLYANVSQSSPVRISEWATNAGPPTITTAAVNVARGDVVVSTVHVGHENRSFTWTSPMVEGVENQKSTSTHTTADYAVGSGVTSVTPAATCNAPNRQAMIAAVLQPRSLNNGSGVIPTTLVLYEFAEQPVQANLVGHWTFDDDGSGGALAVSDEVNLSDSARIEGYRSAAGVYSGTNSGLDVTLVTNTSGSGNISVSNSAVITGSTYNRPGANPTTVVSISGSGLITGNRYEQSVQFTFPTISSPSGMPSSSGNRTINSGSTTISSDVKYDNLTLNSGANLTISGDVRIWVTGDVALNGTAQIIINNGSRLRLYVGDDVTLASSSRINNNTNAPTRFELHQYGSDGDLSMSGTSTLSGIVYVKRDVILTTDAILHGALYVGDDLTLEDNAKIRTDLSQPGFGITPVLDATNVNQAEAHDNVTFAQAGARAYTGTSLRFDGSNDFVRIAHHDDYLLSHGTISLWFNSASLSGTKAILSKDSSGYDNGGHFHLYTEGNTLKARIQSAGNSPYGTGNDFTASSSGLSTNTWYHVTVTFGAGGLRLYVNGSLAQTVSYPGGMGANSGGIGNYQPLILGAGTSTAGDLTHLPVNEHFNGRIDDVRLYDAVLDAAQISRLYQGQAIGDRTEPSYVVADTSGQGDPLNLYIDNTQAVAWSDAGLALDSATVIRSADLPDKIRNGVTATGEFTIEIIATAADTGLGGTLLRYGAGTGSNNNFTVTQDTTRHHAAVRTSTTGNAPSALSTEEGSAAGIRHHILVTFKEDKLRIYRDNILIADEERTGDLLAWDSTFGLTLANNPAGSSAWRGTIERVAVYDRAMNTRQADNLFNNLPPGDGATNSASLRVKWIENR